jgi:hypothetical protein
MCLLFRPLCTPRALKNTERSQAVSPVRQTAASARRCPHPLFESPLSCSVPSVVPSPPRSSALPSLPCHWLSHRSFALLCFEPPAGGQISRSQDEPQQKRAAFRAQGRARKHKETERVVQRVLGWNWHSSVHTRCRTLRTALLLALRAAHCTAAQAAAVGAAQERPRFRARQAWSQHSHTLGSPHTIDGSFAAPRCSHMPHLTFAPSRRLRVNWHKAVQERHDRQQTARLLACGRGHC